jgi:hypothetical protein
MKSGWATGSLPEMEEKSHQSVAECDETTRVGDATSDPVSGFLIPIHNAAAFGDGAEQDIEPSEEDPPGIFSVR